MICFDPDEGGVKGAVRAHGLGVRYGAKVVPVRLKDDLDVILLEDPSYADHLRSLAFEEDAKEELSAKLREIRREDPGTRSELESLWLGSF